MASVFRSKRTWGIITVGAVEIAHALFPSKVPDLSALIRAIFGGI